MKLFLPTYYKYLVQSGSKLSSAAVVNKLACAVTTISKILTYDSLSAVMKLLCSLVSMIKNDSYVATWECGARRVTCGFPA